MDSHVKEYFKQFSKDLDQGFHKLYALHDNQNPVPEGVISQIEHFPHGWIELMQLKPSDRIELVRDFWLSKIPFCPHLLEKVDLFFQKLDDIGVFLVQRTFDDPFVAEMVYSLKEDGGFFRGNIPAVEEQLYHLQKCFPETILPEDYMAFMSIHNGFSKASDTGIHSLSKLWESYQNFQQEFVDNEVITTTKGSPVNPKSLIPFYESFGMPYYQCFWSDWYPENEMGTVYYSGLTHQISNVNCPDPNNEQMAFNTFTEWLLFYLETIA